MLAFFFVWTEDILKTELFRNMRDFPERVLIKHKSKITGDCCVF